jgi:hypothetical protein
LGRVKRECHTNLSERPRRPSDRFSEQPNVKREHEVASRRHPHAHGLGIDVLDLVKRLDELRLVELRLWGSRVDDCLEWVELDLSLFVM